jgi:hypothetical protein
MTRTGDSFYLFIFLLFICAYNAWTGDLKKIAMAQVAQACNPSYSVGRDQEYRNLKPAWVNSSRDPISETPNTKKKG